MKGVKETEKIVIVKPVACRPGFSNLKSFSELLADAVNASPPAAFSETAVAVIKPRTVRFKPICNRDLLGAEVFGSAVCDKSDKVPESKLTSNVVYKPIAKLVSKRTVSLLANMGGQGISSTRENAEAGAPIQPPNQANHEADPTSDCYQNLALQSEKDANAILENSEGYNKSMSLPVPNNGNRPSYDGHSWRKYGQKQVKGSEYPRSYYKCTHPNCPVKKKVEKKLDGQIAEIVYKGEHNHPKPQPLNHNPLDRHAQEPANTATQNEGKNPSWTNEQAERIKGQLENENDIESSAQSTFSGAAPPINDLVTAATCNASVSTSNNSLGLSGECQEVSETLEAEGHGFGRKRTKRGNQLINASQVGEPSSEPRIVVQNNTDSDIVGDGFRWRKYGQKVVKSNPYPRSYYRCTSPKCNVRKYVERTSEDPGTFITTYEGRHNHSMPIKHTNAEASKTSTKKKP
ncbi:WRKY transcription factor 44 [Sesamum alatum]|uniref:WRKY transcription factor 44 n=1 Tax=Sesamum alatum TaxID=300844 RepID=A0AAE2CEF3_9LAMI|nr:WRKY transcription factor 44 [Sesamum alatum]